MGKPAQINPAGSTTTATRSVRFSNAGNSSSTDSRSVVPSVTGPSAPPASPDESNSGFTIGFGAAAAPLAAATAPAAGAASTTSTGSGSNAGSAASAGSNAGSATGSSASNTGNNDDDYNYNFFTRSELEDEIKETENWIYIDAFILVSNDDGLDSGTNFLDTFEDASQFEAFSGYAAFNAILQATRKKNKPHPNVMKLICHMPPQSIDDEIILPTQSLFFLFLAEMILHAKLEGKKSIDIHTDNFSTQYELVRNELETYNKAPVASRKIFGVSENKFKMGFEEETNKSKVDNVSWWERVKKWTGSFVFVNAADVDFDHFVTIFNMGPAALLALFEIEQNFYNTAVSENIKSVVKELQAYREADEVALEQSELKEKLDEAIKAIHSGESTPEFIYENAEALIEAIKMAIAKKAAAGKKEVPTKIDLGEDDSDDDESEDDSGDEDASGPKYPHGPDENARIGGIIRGTHPTSFPSFGSLFSGFGKGKGKKQGKDRPATPSNLNEPAGTEPPAPRPSAPPAPRPSAPPAPRPSAPPAPRPSAPPAPRPSAPPAPRPSAPPAPRPSAPPAPRPSAPPAPRPSAPPAPRPSAPPAAPATTLPSGAVPSDVRIIPPPTAPSSCVTPAVNVNDATINVGAGSVCPPTRGGNRTRKNRKLL
jgi:hypothetical protein